MDFMLYFGRLPLTPVLVDVQQAVVSNDRGRTASNEARGLDAPISVFGGNFPEQVELDILEKVTGLSSGHHSEENTAFADATSSSVDHDHENLGHPEGIQAVVPGTVVVAAGVAVILSEEEEETH